MRKWLYKFISIFIIRKEVYIIMKNIYDIRREDNLYFVLQRDSLVCEDINIKRAAVIIFLYYEDCLDYCLTYIDLIPEYIDIYIVSNNQKIYSSLFHYIKTKKIQLVQSKNRGRDVSGLLVACREIALQYEYFCFVHDKKKKEYITEEDYKLWLDNLWDNTLGSEKYILNVLHTLETNKKIGLLVPPEPIGKDLRAWYDDNIWGNDFEKAQQLAEELNLKCDLNSEKMPITLGTAFWAKSKALKKILKKNWTFEDFDVEPLKDDGTISHAIERLFGYVAQDAGYYTGTLMNTSYAEKLLCIAQEYLSVSYHLLKNNFNISEFEKYLEVKEKKKELYRFCQKNAQIYLYGAGKVGKLCLHLLRIEGYEPKGFIVTDNVDYIPSVEGIQVKTLDMIDNNEIGIIITSAKFYEDIEKILDMRNVKNYFRFPLELFYYT